MKVFGKICLIISLILIGCSALCLGVGIAFGSSLTEVRQLMNSGSLNIGNLHIGSGEFYIGTAEEERQEYSFPADAVEHLDMDTEYGKTGYGKITFVESDTNEIQVTICAKQGTYRCELENDTLILEDTAVWHKMQWTGMEDTLEISIPKNKVFDSVRLETDAAEINLNCALEAKEIEMDMGAGELLADAVYADKEFQIDVGAGNVRINDFSAKELDIDCGVGNVNLRGRIKKELNADCGIGTITMVVFGTEDEYNYEVDCGVGKVVINDHTISSLANRQQMDNHAAKDMYLDCGVGTIEIKMIQEGEV